MFEDYYKYRMGQDVSGELLGAFIEVLNDEDEDLGVPEEGGAVDEAEAS